MPRMPRRRRPVVNASPELHPSNPLRLWLLRLLVRLGVENTFLSRDGYKSHELAAALGLGTSEEETEWDVLSAKKTLHRLHAQAELEAREIAFPPILKQNLARLTELAQLSATDQKILAFCAYIHTESLLDNTADELGFLSSAKLAHVLGVLLDLPVDEVRAALAPQATLARTGLVSVDRRNANTLSSKLDLLTATLADHLMCSDEQGLDSLFRDIVRRAPAPSLNLGHFEHINASLAILKPYLARAHASGRQGVNIFLYGPPGTGKTQLARVLAQHIGCELLEVASQNDDGDGVEGERRLRAYRFTQSFFTQQRALVLFDEAEDVFNDGNPMFGRKSTAQLRKAWINATLEENVLPTLWLSNSVSCLDPAFARRFDMVIEVPVPPRKQRERLIRETCGSLLPDITVGRIAEQESIAPALIARAAAVVGAIADTLPQAQLPGAVEHILAGTLVAQGHPAPVWGQCAGVGAGYDPTFIRADADLAAVATGIATTGGARLCLYGPPGTGKTAYGRWLAEQLGAPIHERRASDLLSKYVGGTEKNFAQAFQQAQQDRAVLLLDEVDSFLQDRRHAARSWEITEVNEMLTQLERFPGVLVATTNLVDDLDPAALRRFDLKVKFDYLTPDQAWRLFERHCAAQGFGNPEAALKREFEELTRLTPGDFAAVARQHRFRPANGPEGLLEALKGECAFKAGGMKGRLGFV